MVEQVLTTAAPPRSRRVRVLRVLGRVARRYLPPLLLLALFIAIWQATVVLFSVPSYIFPAPSTIVHALTARGWGYLPDVWITLQEILAGFGLSLAIGVPLAVLIALSPALRDALYPLLISSQMVPTFALAAVITIAFAYGLLPQIIVTTLYSFFPIVVNTADGLVGVDPDLVNLLRAMGASEWQMLHIVRLPAALPALSSGSKLAMTFAVTGAVVGEWIGGESGLGYLIRFQDNSLDVPGMFATVVVLSLLGIVLFALIAVVEYLALPWHRDSDSDLGAMWRAE
jgi:NitT/TauT family transport system permease protein